MDSLHTIGERLAYLRRRRNVTQEGLAERSQVSVDVIRRLEQGNRKTARLTSLASLARALDVELSTLLAPPPLLERPVNNGSDGGLLEIRRALTAVDPPADSGDQSETAELPSLMELRQSATRSWDIYQRGEYSVLGSVLPELIFAIRHATREFSGEEQLQAYMALSTVCHIAAGVTVVLGKADLAYIACERSIDAAEHAGNVVLKGAAQNLMSWIFRRQGRYEEAEHFATGAAEEIEPSFVRSTPAQLSVFGSLLLNASGAAARNDRGEQAEELLKVAHAAASRLGADRNDLWAVFGPTNVAMTAVNNAVELDELGKALHLVDQAPRSGKVPPTWRARYLLNVAFAQCEFRRDEAAISTLFTVKEITPEWIKYHPLGRDVTYELLGRASTSQLPRLRELADHLGLEP